MIRLIGRGFSIKGTLSSWIRFGSKSPSKEDHPWKGMSGITFTGCKLVSPPDGKTRPWSGRSGMQSRKRSLIESLVNTLSGFALSYALWPLFITPVFGITASHSEVFVITVVFTLASILRNYVCRRIFNFYDAHR